MAQRTRPVGVTILAVLEGLVGLVWLLVGAGMMMIGAIMPIMGMFMLFLGAIAGAIGFVFLILGIVAFLFAYGLYTGKGWAWLWALILAVIGIIFSLLGGLSSLLPIIINLIIIYYLTRPHVKAFFGK